MRLSSFLLCASQPMLTLFSLALLVPIPGAHGHPHFPLAILPTLENPEWEADLLQLQASLDVPGAVAAAGLRSWGQLLELGPEDPRLGLLRELVAENSWGQKGLMRGQRGDLERRPLGPFPGHPMDTLHYQEGGEEEGEGGGKRNEALTSIAGGLQAFNREKGGFGFRFGRK
ncbi:uncharacterized protein qrfp [Salmo salar]|uniref:Uncharacterized protein qrfp n=1 Tax=Salmo salar TaxID=8030 RepID=A0ABM3E3H0_SALSA|nr:uncharacterized protein LOC123730942 [Salmo salar]